MRAGSRARRASESASHPRGRTAWGAQAAVGLIGLLFLFPLGYLIWRTLTLGGDFDIVAARQQEAPYCACAAARQ